MAKQMTFASAMKDFFGMKKDQRPIDFMQEIKALTAEDRDYFTKGLATVGYEIVAAP